MKHKQKKNHISSEEKHFIIRTLVIAAILTAVGFMIPSVSLPVWAVAFIILVWNFKDYIPYSDNYDSDYVDRYFKAQEDARLNTKAYLHQAYLHKDEIKRLNDLINKK